MKFENFVDERVSVVASMAEGEDKERAIRNLVEVVKADTEATKVAYSNSLEMARLDSNEVLERERLAQAKELEELRFAHERELEALRAESAKEKARLERTSKLEKVAQYGLDILQVVVPAGIFLHAIKVDKTDGYVPSMAKSIMTKLPSFRKK